ncbi:MAG: L-serine ammonia-lyase, iron-sulfur-dependent, subunit alpha [Oscillospiraceae bacterium]|jgi:L-cysteine desulfidase|nr:L-serine ammonia-lyase, iron-sulfur-dependent, subunit alpha [Oscillospiraceae bacterium]
MNRALICQILNHEMMLATGCTEPAAIALTAATARLHLPAKPVKIDVSASANIIKNAMAAGIPGTSYTGIRYAAALGAVCGQVGRQLQVVDDATPEDLREAARLVQEDCVALHRADNPDKLYIDITLTDGDGHTARAVTCHAHTNIVWIEEDGKAVFTSADGSGADPITPQLISKTLSLRVIYEFVETLDREKDDLRRIEDVIRVNQTIAEVGTAGDYGLNIGRNIRENQKDGLMGHDIATNAAAATASGADARMAGANTPVVTNSGSGNQGITATVPVLSAGRDLGLPEDRIFRAVTLSNLVAIHIHSGFGLLSGLCGATIAGTGAACGIAYLQGATLKQIGYTVNNMLAAVTGMLCDGAKADCALKIYTCTSTAFQCASMALRGIVVQSTDGIVEDDPEKTIQNFVRLGNEGSGKMDDLVLQMLLKKQ